MSRRRRKSKKTGSSKSPATRVSLDELLENAYQFLERDQPEKALEVLEKAPVQFQQRAEFLFARGYAYQLLSNDFTAIEDFENGLRKAPRYLPAYLGLAISYANLDLMRHAWRYAEQFLRKHPEEPESEALAEEILTDAKADIADQARQAGIPFKKYEQAALPHERAQRFLAVGKFKRAQKELDNAVRLTPESAPPRNNRSLAQYYLGRTEEAIAEAETVLNTIDANETNTLSNLILFHHSLWQKEKAAQYADRLRDIALTSTYDEINLPKAIESLGLWEDDETLWRLAKDMLNEPAYALPGNSWYVLGAAAANTNHLSEAERLLKRSKKEGTFFEERVEQGLQAIKKAKRKRKPVVGPSLTGQFPYTHISQVWPSMLATDLFEQMIKIEDPSLAERQLKRYVKRHPFVLVAMRLILWNEEDEILRELALDALAVSGLPEAYDEIKQFATSQYGHDDQRKQALIRLQKSGYIEPGTYVRFWSAQEGEWSEISTFSSIIEDADFSHYHPDAIELMEKSMQILNEGPENEVNLEQAIKYLKEAIEIDPNYAMAIHNLGTIYIIQGKEEEGQNLIRESVEVEPGYLHGHVSLASIEFHKGDLDACQEHLRRVLSAPSIPPNVMERTLEIQLQLSVTEEDMDSTKIHFEMLKTLNPENPQVATLEPMLKFWDATSGLRESWIENTHRYRERQLKKPISADENLASCLDRITRESLVGALRIWGLKKAGRKAEVIARLDKVMRDPEMLCLYLEAELSQDERDALAWVLEDEGIRPWEEFNKRYGDDIDESPYWQYHEPETIPGRLRMTGLLAVGTFDGNRVALIPADLRPVLKQIS